MPPYKPEQPIWVTIDEVEYRGIWIKQVDDYMAFGDIKALSDIQHLVIYWDVDTEEVDFCYVGFECIRPRTINGDAS